jgi:uncharacterized membrane protein
MDYFQQYLALVDGYKIITILALIFVDFIMGILVALKEGNFQLSKIAEFLNTSVLYFLGGYLVLGVAAVAEPAIGKSVITGAWVLLDATMIGLILAKARRLGLSIPDKLT